jgi:hypothetical protein
LPSALADGLKEEHPTNMDFSPIQEDVALKEFFEKAIGLVLFCLSVR